MGLNFKFHLSKPKNALRWRERRIMTHCALGCVQRCDLWAWWRKDKRTETFMRQTGHLPRPPTST